MTQAEFAELLKVSQPSICLWESGQVVPRPATIELIRLKTEPLLAAAANT